MAKKINVKLILELRSAGMGRNAIAASRHISKNSVGDVFHIADRMGISYEDIAQMDEDTVYRKFYPDKFALESLYDKPDYEYVHQELKRTGVTLKLLWQEYQDKCRASGNIPMGYTKYCQGYSEYTIVNKLTNHLEHKPGVAVEVDWSGPTMTYVDTSTGEIVTVYLFVGTLPYSQYSYVEPDLLMEYGDSTVVAGNQRKLLERYSRIPLLILDEWLVSDISDAELHFLFELMERRSDTTSTIFCTQYRKDDWVKRLGEGVRAEAIVDRYAYTAFWIETGSTNMREYCAKHKR